MNFLLQNQEFVQQFIEEARTHLEKIESILVKSNQLINDSELVNEVFRAVHSIKGTAGFFGLKNIVSLSHAMENVFGEVRNGNIQISENITDLMLKSNDTLKDMIEDVYASENYEVNEFIGALNNILNEKMASGEVKVKNCITIINKNKSELIICDQGKELIEYGLKHGHHIYEIKLKLNKDLMSYKEGPISLVKKLQSVATIVETISDHSEITSFEDVLESIENGFKDVYLGLIVTSVVDAEMLAQATDLGIDCIDEVTVVRKGNKENQETAPTESIEEERTQNKNTSKPEEPKQVIKKKNITENDTSKSQTIKNEDSIRVNVQILNDLLNLASELVLGRNQLLRTLEDHKKSIPGLATILQNVDHLTSSLQEKIMRTRMQPVGNVFNKFPRIIRDISKTVGKEIDLLIEGSEVELDKSMIEALADPLTHLVRNSADHGLESPEDREELHKNRIGTIKLKAYHEGGFVNIDVTDDGAGIDVEKVKNKAVDKQLITRNEADKINTQEALKLIFKPGFSTKEEITDVSGRGVGMDVVKTNIEKLGGSVEIYTSAGNGTTIRLVMPLTLAIIQSLIVESNGQRYALPQVNMQEIVRVKEGNQTRKIENINGSDVIRLRGTLLPIVHLTNIFKINKEKDEGAQKEVSIIIVLKIGMIRFGIAVDSITGSEETLVKALPKSLKECIFYSGVTIMGDGKPAMILDPDGIIKASQLDIHIQNLERDKNAKENANIDAEIQDLLLFKSSSEEKFAIDMNMVARVEEVDIKDIQRAGDREFLKFRNHSLRIIRLENYLPIQASSETQDRMYVIIPKLVTHPMGILVNSIIDNVRTNVNLNTEDMKIKGILGTSLLNNDLILFLHLYELFELADPDHYLTQTKKVQGDYKILFAEDTPFFQRVTMDYLLSAGYDITLANNGKEAWDILNIKEFDLILSDIHMPVMDGIELASRVRDHTIFKKIPMIALTSMTDDTSKQKGIDIGFDFYEYKLDRDKLLSVIEKALNAKSGGEE